MRKLFSKLLSFPFNRAKELWNNKTYRRIGLVLILLFFYLAGILAQFLNNRHQWVPGKELHLPSVNPFKCLVMLFTPFGIQAIGGLFCFVLISGLLFYLLSDSRDHLRYDKKRRFYYSTKGTYGTAGWMEQARTEEVFMLTPMEEADTATGIIYGLRDGRLVCRKPDSRLNPHIAVLGASGSMKNRAYARNAIIASALSGESLVVTDPKSELLSDTRGYLEDMGYTVKALDLVNPKRSHRFDGLDGVLQNPLAVSQIVEAVIANTGGSTGDYLFDTAEGYLLSALIFLQMENGSDEYPSLGRAYKTLLSAKSPDELSEQFCVLPENSHGRQKWNLFSMASENVRGNVMIGLGARLQVLEHEEIAELMAYPDMDFTALGKERTAYFLVLSDQDNTMRFISAMFFSLLFMRLVHYADNECPGKQLPVGVNLILDEFCNLVGAIHSFHIKISTVRSRNIRIAIICQSIGQLQNRYPDNLWSEIIGNTDTILFLGCTDPLTAEFISDRTGEITIGVDTTMRQRSLFMPFDLEPSYRQSEGAGRRMLLTPDEVLRLEPEKMLIILKGEQVLEAEKFDYTRNAESRKFRTVEPFPVRSTVKPVERKISTPLKESGRKKPRSSASLHGKAVMQHEAGSQLSFYDTAETQNDVSAQKTVRPDLTK
ncbi:type IV secretory system conjugative DNA transfer family protein [Oscillospiraceae bacterium MB08-C2-2]|nr:type IV secretory system conjugative DNA transfer family protein [Oscillospiraceae bacterium MB08-C2-2]